MNTPELIFETIRFFFSGLWIYIGLIFLIITIRGDVSRGLTGTKEFIRKVFARYRDRNKQIESFKSYRNMPGKE